MKKRICLLLLCCIILVSLPIQALAFPHDGTIGTGGASWTLYGDGTLVVQPGHVHWNGGETSPWHVHRLDVEKIIFDGPGFTVGPRLRSLFRDLPNVHTITGLEYLDTSTIGDNNDMTSMFRYASSLVHVGDLSGWDVSNVRTMHSMFMGRSLTGNSLVELDLSGWNTGNVTDMSHMFRDTHSLTSIGDVSDWNVGSVTNMNHMFRDARSLTSLNLAGWNTSAVTSMYGMFRETHNLTCIGGVSAWNTSSVTTMHSMFMGSAFTELDLSGWNTGNVESMAHMFRNASSLVELDLSGWDTGNVTDMASMFVGANALRQLTLGEDFAFIGGTAAALPAVPNNATYTGVWINLETSQTLSSAQLMHNEGSPMAGTWTWQMHRGIQLTPCHDFGQLPAGEMPPEHTARVTNVGALDTGNLTITLTGENPDSFILSMPSHPGLENAGDYFTFTVVPASGLPVGTHTAIVTVSGTDIEPQSFTVTFVVEAAPQSPPTRPPINVPPTGAYEIHLAFMFGDDRGDFRPLASITRAEVATVLARTQLTNFTSPETRPAGMDTFDSFADVLPNHWHYYYIAWAYKAELVTGDPPRGDGTRSFRPNDPITRQEFAAMVARINDVYQYAADFAHFHDWDQVSVWARQYVYTAFRTGWMVGDQGMFRPLDNISRAEVATAINRTLNRVDSWAAFEAIYLRNPYAARDFPDMTDTGWYVPSVIAATNDHRLGRGGTPIWKEILPHAD